MFRHSLLLAGGAVPTQPQCASMMKCAVDACERYYQAFQFVLWAGKSARESLDAACSRPKAKRERRTVAARLADVVGAGKMGGAMLAGWLDAGLDPSATTVIDPARRRPWRSSAPRGASRSIPPIRPPPRCWCCDQSPRDLRRPRPRSTGSSAAKRCSSRCWPARRSATCAGGFRGVGRGAGHAQPSGQHRPRRDGRLRERGRRCGQRASAEALLSASGTVAWLDDEALIDAVTASRVGGGLCVPDGRDPGGSRDRGRLARRSRASGTGDGRGRGRLLDADPTRPPRCGRP